MYCNRCQTDCEEGSYFCHQCGKKLPIPLRASADSPKPQSDGTSQCPSCKENNLTSSRFCWQCGAAINPNVQIGSAWDLEMTLRHIRECMSGGQLDEALNFAAQAVADAPNDVRPHELLGDLYIKLEQYEEAAKEFQIGLTIIPNNLELRRKLAAATGEKIRDSGPRDASATKTPGTSDQEAILQKAPWYSNKYYKWLSVLFCVWLVWTLNGAIKHPGSSTPLIVRSLAKTVIWHSIAGILLVKLAAVVVLLFAIYLFCQNIELANDLWGYVLTTIVCWVCLGLLGALMGICVYGGVREAQKFRAGTPFPRKPNTVT
jgi:DNA-directed RNA polymerase subunit RPC12/RpoP